ncbi:hypothetical protein A4H97_15400 [Niastella yeongjuensis]|uniref:Transporter n=1 Tax=Niastella yeongjuensis TaxID=354355 RepID=A0A1V9E4N6_9BACT|nr:hypothetical protein [Niastella yeongjuensis]OQP40984.1 hypothetical protein A4H97_15400 [Niastella yeongjuensis]SEO95750.1 hypothetical protein SAMN05660816_03970 [Niastella yeongjuensis]
MKRILLIGCITGCICLISPAMNGQQYNSDSYLSKPWGTITIIPTVGKRSSMLMTTYSLFPKWEFTIASYLYNNDDDPLTNDGYSASLYAKYMFYENKAKTGGFAAKAGTGTRPGTLDAEFRVKDAFKTYWINTPGTIPFFNNKLSVDLMPGVSTTINYGDSSEHAAWAFTYSARAAWYPFGPKASIVGEVFGASGEAGTMPEYKIGLRWEPSQHAVFALTYGQEFNGTQGAGFEFGIMLFTPPFACFGGCTPKQKKK